MDRTRHLLGARRHGGRAIAGLFSRPVQALRGALHFADGRAERLDDARHLVGHRELSRDDRPGQHRPDVGAVEIGHRGDLQIEGLRTDLDLRPVRQPAHVCEHRALMMRVLVKDVEGAPHHVCDLDGQVALDGLQGLARCVVNVIDLEVVLRIGGHDRDRHVVDHPEQPIVLVLLRRDVAGELDDLEGLAVRSHDRIVARLEPDLRARACPPLKLPGDELTAPKHRPEVAILGARRDLFVDEHPVVLRLNIREFVSDDGEEIGVGPQDRAVHAELDDRQRSNQGIECGLCFVVGRLAEHGCTLLLHPPMIRVLPPTDSCVSPWNATVSEPNKRA